MKTKRRIARIGSAVLLVLFLCYLGYQLLQNMSASIQTAEALVTKVEETVEAEGIFVRNQTVITGSGGSSARYLVENGERVGKGQKVAVFFDSEAAAEAFQTCRDLENQLSALEEAYSSLTSGADSLKMDSMIYEDLQQLAGLLESGSLTQVARLYSSLGQLVVSRSAGDAGQEQMEQQIAAAKAELTDSQSKLSGGSRNILASDAGYFLKAADGYETQFSAESLDALTPEQILSAVPDAQSGDAVGSLVKDFAWYYAAVVDSDTAERLRNRSTVTIRFPQLGGDPVEVQIVKIHTFDDTAVMVLKSTTMDERYLSARKESVEFVLASYAGIKVPKEALRQVDGVWGVYCLDGSVAQFKPVSWTYQTEGYYLVPCADSPSEGLYRYDKMILKAKNLENNQVVS